MTSRIIEKLFSFFNYIGLKRQHLFIAFWFLLVFFAISFVIVAINFRNFGAELTTAYFFFISPLILGTSLLGVYLYRNKNIIQKSDKIDKGKIKRQLKIATGCYVIYFIILMIIGGIETVLIMENLLKEDAKYSELYFIYGYPIIAVLFWRFMSKHLE